jgi:hypothetical protein
MGEIRNACRVLVVKYEGKRPLERWEVDIEYDL